MRRIGEIQEGGRLRCPASGAKAPFFSLSSYGMTEAMPLRGSFIATQTDPLPTDEIAAEPPKVLPAAPGE